MLLSVFMTDKRMRETFITFTFSTEIYKTISSELDGKQKKFSLHPLGLKLINSLPFHGNTIVLHPSVSFNYIILQLF